MILACPNCKTRFTVPDGAIPAEGRKVRCATCKNSWQADPTQAIKPTAPKRPAQPQPAAPQAPRPQMPFGNAPQGMPQGMQQGAPHGQAHQGQMPPPAYAQPGMPQPGMQQPNMQQPGMPGYNPQPQGAPAYGAPPADPYAHGQTAQTGYPQQQTAYDQMTQHMGQAQTPEPTPEPGIDVDPATRATMTADIRRNLMEEPDDRPSEFDEFDGPAHAETDEFSDDGDTAYDEQADDPFAEADNFQDALDGIDDFASTDFDSMGGDLEDDSGETGNMEDALTRLRARAHREEERAVSKRRKILVSTGWALLVAAWIAIPLLVLGFPDLVREKWPASQALYDWMNSNSDRERLRAEAETLSPAITDAKEIVDALLTYSGTEERSGETLLVMKGFVENKGRRAARVPKLRISIFDAAGKVLDTWVFDPPGRLFTRGQRVEFEQTRPIPPGANRTAVAVVEGQYSETEAEGRL